MEQVRIGLMLPSNNVVVEPEYYSLGIAGFTFHSDKLLLTSDTLSGLGKMLKEVGESARIFASFSPDAIAYCCLSSSLMGGRGWDKKIGERIGKLTGGIPTVVAATAILDALGELGLREVATFSGYGPTTNRKMTEFLAANGVKVTATRGLDLGLKEVGRLGAEDVRREIVKSRFEGAEGLLVGSTDLEVMSAIGRLERDLAVPVVSVNQAVLWSLLKLLGRETKVPGYGELLDGSH